MKESDQTETPLSPLELFTLGYCWQTPDTRKRVMRGFLFVIIVLGFALLQLPFVKADADSSLSWSRGPYTDEGLYSAQVRNALVTGHLDLTEADGIMIEPLFEAVNWLSARFLADRMTTARTSVMLAAISGLTFLASWSGPFARTIWIAIPFVFLSYYPFHYAHLDMAEFPCSIAILFCIAATGARLRGGANYTLVLGAIAAAVTYAIKIQYLYVAAIPPTAFVLAIVIRHFSGLPIARTQWFDLGGAALCSVIFASLFFLAWVVPNRELFAHAIERIFEQQARLGSSVVLHNLHDLIRDVYIWPIFVLVMVGTAALWWQCHTGAGSSRVPEEWIASTAPLVAWLLLESHKLGLSYLPSRYLVSAYVAAGMLGAAALSLTTWPAIKGAPRSAVTLVAALGVLALGLNVAYYVRSLRDRHYTILDAQTAFQASGKWRGKVVVGPWAPALFWGSGAITRHVLKGYNDRDILARQHPAAIVTEPDQSDSDGAFARDGIKLPPKVDYKFDIGPWRVDVYEMNGHP